MFMVWKKEKEKKKKKLDGCCWRRKANGTAFYLFTQHLLANSLIVPRISDLWKKTCGLRVGERLLKRMLRWRRTRKSLKCTKSTGLIAFVQAIGLFFNGLKNCALFSFFFLKDILNESLLLKVLPGLNRWVRLRVLISHTSTRSPDQKYGSTAVFPLIFPNSIMPIH